ncbi:MAG: sigma factor, partial [Solirubrobacterales bacterium]
MAGLRRGRVDWKILHPAGRPFVRLTFGGRGSPPEVETPVRRGLTTRADRGCRGTGHGVDVPHQGPSAARRLEEDRRSRALEDWRLLVRYHRDGDRAAREQLVERLLPLARRMARRYRRSDEPLDDLVHVATLGLIKAND